MDAFSAQRPNIELLMDVPVKLTVELGSCQMLMKDVLQLTVGSVVQLDKVAEAPVELFVNQKLLARGEVVVVEDRLGIKITQIIGDETPGSSFGAIRNCDGEEIPSRTPTEDVEA